eukprot:298810-Prorocentrum_lima.AAC.1
MWKKTAHWRFYCHCDWTVLEKEGRQDPSDKHPVTVWYTYMKAKHSPSVESWPKVGCGARFLSWKRGASMVMEMQMKDGSWEASMAQRFPQNLDDEIKN